MKTQLASEAKEKIFGPMINDLYIGYNVTLAIASSKSFPLDSILFSYTDIPQGNKL
jgi:hypothetical protein